MNRLFVTTTALSIAALVSATAATAGTYSGNWLITVSNSRDSNGTYCLTLTDDGSFGWRHSGEATLPDQQYTGSFQDIKGLLVATIPFASGTAETGAFVFTGRAEAGNINPGEYEEVYGGENDSGVDKFKKNGC